MTLVRDSTSPLRTEPGATLHGDEIAQLAAAQAAVDPRGTVFSTIQRIAVARMDVSMFSASICFLETMELERIHSSRPDVYPVGGRKSKRQTSWARQVMEERRIFVGEGPLEMAAAFDDQERMASLGIRSIVNVPVVVRDRCLGVLNFGRDQERIPATVVLLAGLLGLTAAIAFLPAAR